MLKKLALFLLGLIPCYVLAGLVTCQSVAPPWQVLTRGTDVLSQEEVAQSLAGAEYLGEGQYVARRSSVTLEIPGLQERVARLDSVTCELVFEGGTPHDLYLGANYAAPGQDYTGFRGFSAPVLPGQKTQLDFRPGQEYTPGVDSVRLEMNLAGFDEVFFTVKEISLNRQNWISLPVFLAVYAVYAAILLNAFYVEKREKSGGAYGTAK